MSAPSFSLSRETLSVLLTVINTPKMEWAVEGPTCRDIYTEMVMARLMSPVDSRQATLWVDGMDRELLPNPQGPGYRYFSASAGWVHVDASAVTRCRIDVRRFLGYVRAWLTIPSHQPINELLHNSVWDLGDMWVIKSRRAVLFARRAHLPLSVVNLRDALSVFPRRRAAVVLTDVALSRQGPSLPGEPFCIPLLDLVLPDQMTVSLIDPPLVIEMLGQRPTPTSSKQPVWCSDDGGELMVHGKQYVFTGLTHKKILRQLFDAWEAGTPTLRTAAVLENAESHSKTVSQAFSGCKTDWRSLVGYEQGYCWLIV